MSTITIEKPTTFAAVLTNERHVDLSAADLICSLITLKVYLEDQIKTYKKLDFKQATWDTKQDLITCNGQITALRGR